jgi:hypothetical protein
MLANGIEFGGGDKGGLEYVMGRRRSFNKRIKKKRREKAKKAEMKLKSEEEGGETKMK